MITIDMGQLVVSFILAMGVPSGIFGLIVWRLKQKITAKEKHAEDLDKAQKNFFLLMVQSTGAAIALGEATAKAVQRIPDAHCNGDMHAALAYAADIKHKQKDFLAKQGIDALIE